MSTGDGWTVHFLDEALGTVRAATTGKPTTVVASAIVMNAIRMVLGPLARFVEANYFLRAERTKWSRSIRKIGS